jgi:hypothetical protein
MGTKVLTLPLLLILVFFFASCMNKRDKSRHKFSTEIMSDFYLETYSVASFGAFSTDILADYLTDSISFRIFIDTYSEGEETISYSIVGDTIILSKYTISKYGGEPVLIYSNRYPIPELKELNSFE